MAPCQRPNTMEVDLKAPEQLINSLDPSPFHERDLERERSASSSAGRERPRDRTLCCSSSFRARNSYRGSSAVKVVPSAAFEVTFNSPPWAATIFLAMNRPRPR